MTQKELYEWSKEYLVNNKVLEFTDEIFSGISKEDSNYLVDKLGDTTLMKLPGSEIKFFEWLKENDKNVWNDLWKSEAEEYIVALNFLPYMLEHSRGFPICDLLENDNYYFVPGHMVDKESEIMIDSVQKRYREHKSLTVEQTLVLEISISPIDLWHFSYRYNIEIDRAKKAVAVLVDDGILVHLKEAEHLANFIDF